MNKTRPEESANVEETTTGCQRSISLRQDAKKATAGERRFSYFPSVSPLCLFPFPSLSVSGG